MTTPHHPKLAPPPPATARQASVAQPPPAQAMAGAFWEGGDAATQEQDSFADPGTSSSSGGKAPPATETIGRRAGSLSDELDFPEFVASLIHGTWDAMVDSSIRQMDAYADLVAAISKPVRTVSRGKCHHRTRRATGVRRSIPAISASSTPAAAAARARAGSSDEVTAPLWLADYGLDGQELTPELIEEQLIPIARDRMARDRMQTLATLVMLGMNRIKVDTGSITARLRFRAAASDKTSVDYAVSDDPASASGSGNWSTRGSTSYAAPVTKSLDSGRQRPDRQQPQRRTVRRSEDQFFERNACRSTASSTTRGARCSNARRARPRRSPRRSPPSRPRSRRLRPPRRPSRPRPRRHRLSRERRHDPLSRPSSARRPARRIRRRDRRARAAGRHDVDELRPVSLECRLPVKSVVEFRDGALTLLSDLPATRMRTDFDRPVHRLSFTLAAGTTP